MIFIEIEFFNKREISITYINYNYFIFSCNYFNKHFRNIKILKKNKNI